MSKAPEFDCATVFLKCLLDNVGYFGGFFSLAFVFLDGERTSGQKMMGGTME